jgi:hypothetical protein
MEERSVRDFGSRVHDEQIVQEDDWLTQRGEVEGCQRRGNFARLHKLSVQLCKLSWRARCNQGRSILFHVRVHIHIWNLVQPAGTLIKFPRRQPPQPIPHLRYPKGVANRAGPSTKNSASSEMPHLRRRWRPAMLRKQHQQRKQSQPLKQHQHGQP